MTTSPTTAAATRSRIGHPLNAVAVVGSALLLAACAAPPPPASQEPSSASDIGAASTFSTACTPAHIAFTLDPGDGRFNGMSHSGTALVLRNIGNVACTLPAQPLPTFSNAERQALHVRTRAAADARPVSSATLTLAPDAAISSDLRWVSGNVYDGGHCLSPVFITLGIGKHALTTRFTGHVCGPGNQPPEATAGPFQPLATPGSATAKALIYACASGRRVQATYPDTNTAVLLMDGQTRLLRIALSADGARYVDRQWQWWTKGMHDAWLAPLAPGETVASANGESCTAT